MLKIAPFVIKINFAIPWRGNSLLKQFAHMVKCKHTSTYVQKEIIEFVKLENKPQKNTREI